MSNKYLNLIKDTFIFAIGSIGSKLILFIMVPIYTNFLTEAEYGVSDLVFTVSQLLIPFLSLVIFDAVIRFGLSKEHRAEDVLLVGLIVIGVGSLVTIAASPLVGLYATLAEWKWYLCVYIVFNMLVSVECSYLKATDQNKLYVIINLTQTLVLASLNVLFLVFMDMGIQGYLLSTVVASIVAAVLAFPLGKMGSALRSARFHKQLFMQMIAFSAPLILNNISWWVIHSANKLMVELMLGAAALGIFTVATKIPSLINVLISIFSQAWGISSVKESEETRDTSFYSNVFSAYTFLIFGACIAAVSIIKPFMGIYVGEAFSTAWQYIPLLLVSAALSAIASYFGSMYSVLKKSMNNMITTLIGAIVNVVVSLFLIDRIGIMGAVIGTLASYATIAFWRIFDVRRYICVHIQWNRFYPNLILAAAQAVLVTFDFHVLIVSVLAIGMFLLINYNEIVKVLKRRE